MLIFLDYEKYDCISVIFIFIFFNCFRVNFSRFFVFNFIFSLASFRDLLSVLRCFSFSFFMDRLRFKVRLVRFRFSRFEVVRGRNLYFLGTVGL